MNELYPPHDRAAITALLHQCNQSGKGLILAYIAVFLNALVSSFVMYFEWELAYTLFMRISDPENQTWQPAVMGLSAFLLVLGFHYVVETRAGDKSFRFITWLTAKVLPIYMLGFGFVIVLLLLKEGLFDLLQLEQETIDFINNLNTAPTNGEWMNDVVAGFVTPAATLAFAAGVGTLVIINVFVAHCAIGKVKQHSKAIAKKQYIKREAAQAARQIKMLEVALSGKQDELSQTLLMDEDAIAAEIGADVFSTLQEGLKRPQMLLEKRRRHGDVPGFLGKSQANLKPIIERVKAFEAITLETIIDLIQDKRKAK